MKLVTGTNNIGKINGAKKAFSKYFEDFEIEGVKVSSDVPVQPFNDQIYMGAKKRINNSPL